MKKFKPNIFQYSLNPEGEQFSVLKTAAPQPQYGNTNPSTAFINQAQVNYSNAIANQKKLEQEAKKRKTQTLAEQAMSKSKETQKRVANIKSTTDKTKVNQNIKKKDLGTPLKDKDLAKENLEYQRALETAFRMNAPYIQGAYGKDINEFYNEEGTALDYSKIQETFSDPEFDKKIEDFKYQDFLKREQEAYDKAGMFEKGLNLTTSFLADPSLTTQNLLFGSEETGYRRPLLGQWQGLNENDSAYKDFYSRATGADENLLNEGLNWLNPAKYLGEAVLSNKEGDIMGTGLNLANALLLGKLNPGKGAAKALSSPYAKSSIKGLKNVLKGKSSVKDLFTKSDLIQIKNLKKLAEMEGKMASGKLDPADYKFFSSLQKSPDALSYAEKATPYIVKSPMTAAEASSFNLKNLTKDLAKGRLSPNDATTVEQALSRSVPSLEEVMSDKALKKIYDNLPKGVKKADVDFALNNPTTYWKNPKLGNNKELTDFLARPDFYSKAEYIMPRPTTTQFIPSSLEALETAAASRLLPASELAPIAEQTSHLGKGVTQSSLEDNTKKQGGSLDKSFNNSGFKSLPLYVQSKIKMGSNNKYQIGNYLIPGNKGYQTKDGMVCDENGCTPEDQYFTDLAQESLDAKAINALQTRQRAAQALVEASDILPTLPYEDQYAKKGNTPRYNYWTNQGIDNLSWGKWPNEVQNECIWTAGSKGFQQVCPGEVDEKGKNVFDKSVFYSNLRAGYGGEGTSQKYEDQLKEAGVEMKYSGLGKEGKKDVLENTVLSPGDMVSKQPTQSWGHAAMFLGKRSQIEQMLKDETLKDSVYNYLSEDKWKEILDSTEGENIMINSGGSGEEVELRKQGLETFGGGWRQRPYENVGSGTAFRVFRHEGMPSDNLRFDQEAQEYTEKARRYQNPIAIANLQTLGLPQVQPETEMNKTLNPTPGLEYKSKRGEKKAKAFSNLISNNFNLGGMMYSQGANMPQGQMTDYPVTAFNEGGTHEENPLGGIPQGMHPNGQPNLVEKGEYKVTDPRDGSQFIISASDEMVLDKETVKEFRLPKKFEGWTLKKAFEYVNRNNSFNLNAREGDTIQENSKNILMEPLVDAHHKLSKEMNAKQAAKKEQEFNKDLDKMMEEYPEYMEALLSQSQQPMQQQGPSPEEMAMMEQQMAQMGGAPGGGMPPMARNGGMYAYGGNMYNFGSTLGAGVAGAAKGILGSIPGVGGMLEGGVDMIHGALDKDITEQDKIAMGVGETVGAAGTAAVTGGATLASGMDNMIGGATEAAANIPGMGEGGQAFLEGANQLSGLAGMIPMRNGGVKMGCGGNKYGKGGKMGCNCYKCGGKMHANGGNIFQNGLSPADATYVNSNLENIKFDVEPMLPGAANNTGGLNLPNVQKNQEIQKNIFETIPSASSTGVNMNLNQISPFTTFGENSNLTQKYINAGLGKNLKNGGNIYQNGDPLENIMMSGYNTNLGDYNQDVTSSLGKVGGQGTEQPSEFTYQRGWGSTAADLAPIAMNLYSGLKKPEEFQAGRIDLKAPQLGFSETEKALDRNLAGTRKAIKAGGGAGSYLSNLIQAQSMGNQATASAYQQMENAQAQLDYDAAKTSDVYNLQQKNAEDQENIRRQMLQGQAFSEAAKGAAGLSDKYATENMAAAYASMANPQFKLNIAGPSLKKGQRKFLSGINENT